MKSNNIVKNQHIKQLYFPLKTALWDQRDGSGLKSSVCSCRWQLKTVILFPKDIIPSSSLCKYQVPCVVWTHMQTQYPYNRNEKQDKQTNLFFKIVLKNNRTLRNSFHSLDFPKRYSYLMNILIEIFDIFRIQYELLIKECFKGRYG